MNPRNVLKFLLYCMLVIYSFFMKNIEASNLAKMFEPTEDDVTFKGKFFITNTHSNNGEYIINSKGNVIFNEKVTITDSCINLRSNMNIIFKNELEIKKSKVAVIANKVFFEIEPLLDKDSILSIK